MKKISLLIYLACTILFFLFLTIWKIDSTDILNSIVTFLSITTGFTVTALSIIATSKFSQKLYSMESEKDNSKTLLHELVDKFKSATKIFLITIALILSFPFVSLYDNPDMQLFSICLMPSHILKSLIFTLTVVSFYKFISLLLLFSKFVIRSVSTK